MELKVLLLSNAEPNALQVSTLKRCQAVQLVGAFSFRNVSDETPGSFAVAVTVNGTSVVNVFTDEHLENFFLRSTKFNLLRFRESQALFKNWLSIPRTGPNANSIDAETARRARLVQISNAPQVSPRGQTKQNGYLNPLVAVMDIWAASNVEDIAVVGHCCNNDSTNTWVDPIDGPEDKLRDILLENLARRLIWLESKNEGRCRSTVERLIFGKKKGEDHHRAFVGLDNLKGTFWKDKTSRKDSGFRWTPAGSLGQSAKIIAQFWCDRLGVIFSEGPGPQWNIYSSEPYRGHRNLASDWRPEQEWNFNDAGLRKLNEFMRNHSERSRSGERLRRFLLRCWHLTPDELPLPIRAWSTYSTPSSANRRLMYHAFVEAAFRSLLFTSRVILKLPHLNTKLDSMVLFRDRRGKRKDRFSERFDNRAFDLTYSRAHGASALFGKLITGLSQIERPSRNKALSYASEWWKGWEDSLYFTAAESSLYFNAPGEGPFYLGVSKFGDTIGLSANELDESEDSHDWVKEIF